MKKYNTFFDYWEKEKPYLKYVMTKDIALDAWDAAIESFPIPKIETLKMQEWLNEADKEIMEMSNASGGNVYDKDYARILTEKINKFLGIKNDLQ
ncbi:MAG: hypothetical protein ACFFHD_15270 [Promethearchaeota archaeon]